MTYAELRELRKEKLMAKYNEFISAGDKQNAWKALADLMRFKLVDAKWAENEVKGTFVKAQRGELTKVDVRDKAYSDRLPDNLLVSVPEGSIELKITSLAHWIIRRELQYVGDQYAPDKVVRFNLSKASTYQTANGVLKDLESIYKKNTGKELGNDWAGRYRNGQVVMYGVKLANGQQYVVSTLGSLVVLPRSKTAAKINVVLDIKSMLEQNIDVINTYNQVVDATKQALNSVGVTDIEVVDMLDYMSAGNKQRADRKPPVSEAEMLEQREQEFDKEKAEDIAFRTHRNFDEVYQEVRDERAKAKAEAGLK